MTQDRLLSYADLLARLERHGVLRVTLTRERTGFVGADGYKRAMGRWHHYVGSDGQTGEEALADLIEQIESPRMSRHNNALEAAGWFTRLRRR